MVRKFAFPGFTSCLPGEYHCRYFVKLIDRPLERTIVFGVPSFPAGKLILCSAESPHILGESAVRVNIKTIHFKYFRFVFELYGPFNVISLITMTGLFKVRETTGSTTDRNCDSNREDPQEKIFAIPSVTME